MTREYHMYLKDDTSNEQLNEARKSFNYEGQDMYYITNEYGNIELVQSERTRPYMNMTLEECAKKHIEDMERQEVEAKEREVQEKAEKEAAEKRQRDLEETVVKQNETLSMLTQLVANMQAQQMSFMQAQQVNLTDSK